MARSVGRPRKEERTMKTMKIEDDAHKFLNEIKRFLTKNNLLGRAATMTDAIRYCRDNPEKCKIRR